MTKIEKKTTAPLKVKGPAPTRVGANDKEDRIVQRLFNESVRY